MYRILAETKNLSIEDWKDFRRKGIGGSDAAAITGYSQYSSPLAVYAIKTGLAEDTEITNKYTRWGKILEPVIRNEFPKDMMEAEEIEVEASEFPYMIQHEGFDWMIGNPDGRVKINGEEGGLEIKTGTSLQAEKWQGDQLPDYYYCQVQHYMAIDRLPWYLVVALIEKDLFWRRVPMNNAFIKDMIDAEKSFWYDHVRSGVPPLPTGSDIDAEYLLKLYPRGEGELYLPELGATCQEYKTLAEKIEDLERRRTEISNTFKARMGNAKLATCEGYKITWSRFKKSQFDRKGLEKALPDIATKYTREIDVDRLTVTELKKK